MLFLTRWWLACPSTCPPGFSLVLVYPQLDAGEIISGDTVREECPKEKVGCLTGPFSMTTRWKLDCAYRIGWIFRYNLLYPGSLRADINFTTECFPGDPCVISNEFIVLYQGFVILLPVPVGPSFLVKSLLRWLILAATTSYHHFLVRELVLIVASAR